MKKKILIVVGTRPNFIKVTQFKNAAKNFSSLEFKIVHTGQHYDKNMADIFFQQFELVPDFFLNILPASAPSQIAQIIVELEKLIQNVYFPDLIIVVGDVNSTLAAAVTSNKLAIPVAHLESGLRSFDKSMPEEHNRVLTDAITNYFFITEPSGLKNLKQEGHSENLFYVGNSMIDTMVFYKSHIEKNEILSELKLDKQEFVLMTMHRPATVDNKEGLSKLVGLVSELTRNYYVVFPIHPRTIKNIEAAGLSADFKNNDRLVLTEPLDYFSFQKLITKSKFIITDSGGIQEESTFLKIPCLTLRPNTERPVTVECGTNTLVPFDLKKIKSYVKEIEEGSYKIGSIPELWDGNATYRIVKAIDKILLDDLSDL